MGKATAPSGGCWLRLASASASETTSASTSAAPAYIHNRRGWLRAACFAKMCVQLVETRLPKLPLPLPLPPLHTYFPKRISITTRGINRPKERDTETVFDSKPSSPVQLHNQQDSFFYSFQTKTKPTIKMAFKVRKAKLARTKLRLSIYCSTLLCVCKCVWEQVICVPQELLRMCLHWIRGCKAK